MNNRELLLNSLEKEDNNFVNHLLDKIEEETYNKAIQDFANWLCDKYEVFEPEDDGYILYGDMKYHTKKELLEEFFSK